MILTNWLSIALQAWNRTAVSGCPQVHRRTFKRSNLLPWLERLEHRNLLATLGLGDIAFTGYQSATPDKISLVLLRAVDSGTVLSISDNAWNGSALATNEGSSVLTFNGNFAAGTQLNFDASRATGSRWAVGSVTTNLSDLTSTNFALAASGDNLFAYSGSTPPTAANSALWVAAFATNPWLSSGSATTSLSFLPAAFQSTNAQLSLGIANGAGNQNGVYSGGNVNGSPDQIRTAVHNASNWTLFTSAGSQSIPPNVTFTVQSGGGNSAPTGLSLSNSSLVENAGANAVVGNFSSTDPNLGDSFTYTFASGPGSTDNSRFNISGNTLRASSSLSPSNLSIRVRTTDQGGLFFEAVLSIQVFASAPNSDLRIVSYNITAADAPGTPRSGLETILQAIGSEIVNGVSRPIDLLALQEVFSQSSTTQLVVGMLNSIYGEGIYARGTVDGASNGAGTQGVVYNTQTLQLLGEATVGTATAGSQPRQTMRYRFQPVGRDLSTEFYVYNSHWKALNDAPSEAQRLVEAQAIRANADALGDGKNILYVGDFNVYSGTDNGFQFMVGAGNGQARDPVNRIGPWSNNSAYVDLFTQAPSTSPPAGLVGGGLDDRFDFQLSTSELFDGTGLEYRANSYRAFGNNGSVPLNGSINSGSSTALAGLPNRTQVLDLLTTVSDHLPVVAEYTTTTVLANPTLTLSAANAVYNAAAYAGASVTITGAAAPVPTATFTYYVGLGTGGTSLGSAAPIDVGTYTVVARTAANSANNAATSAPISFQITAAPLTIGGLAGVSKVYDATTVAAVSGTATLSGVFPADVVTLGGVPAFEFANKNVGNNKAISASGYSIGGAQAANYVLSQPTGLSASITAAPLTITAEPKFKVEGQSDPPLTFTISGLVGGDTALTALTGKLTRTAGEGVGSYLITRGTLAAVEGNYAITFVQASLTITAAAAPTLISVIVNGADSFLNSAQRSVVTSLVVTFSTPVKVAAGAFSITQMGLLATSGIRLGTSQIRVTANGALDEYTIRFAPGPGVIRRSAMNGLGRGHSLIDGNYLLSIDATKVTRGSTKLSNTNSMGDGDNQFGDLATDNFFRLYGDGDGDGLVSMKDAAAFRAATSAYDAAFDADGNGAVWNSGIDRLGFAGNFGKRRRRF